MLDPLPQINIASDTWGAFFVKSQDTISAVSNNAVVVIANSVGDAVSGNGFVSGTFGATTLAATTLRGGNVATSASMNVTSEVVFSNSVLLGNVGEVKGVSLTTTGTNAHTIDSFAVATYRTAKYVVSIRNNSANGYQATELMVMQDGGGAFVAEYATLTSNGALGTFEVDINSGNLRLRFTPTPANTTVKVFRSLLTV